MGGTQNRRSKRFISVEVGSHQRSYCPLLVLSGLRVIRETYLSLEQ